jgi:hypothetical protein
MGRWRGSNCSMAGCKCSYSAQRVAVLLRAEHAVRNTAYAITAGYRARCTGVGSKQRLVSEAGAAPTLARPKGVAVTPCLVNAPRAPKPQKPHEPQSRWLPCACLPTPGRVEYIPRSKLRSRGGAQWCSVLRSPSSVQRQPPRGSSCIQVELCD